MKLKTVEEHKVDPVTGEMIIKRTESVIKIRKEPAFVKWYIDDLSSLCNLSGAEQDVLHHLVRHVDYDGRVSLNVVIRHQIAIESKNISSVNYISRVLKRIESRGIMKRIATNVYFMNPCYFAKGAWKDVSRMRNHYINLNIKYTSKGRIVKATIEERSQ